MCPSTFVLNGVHCVIDQTYDSYNGSLQNEREDRLEELNKARVACVHFTQSTHCT